MTDRPVKVLVFDDEKHSAEAIQARLADIEGVEATCISGAGAAVDQLESRRQEARNGAPRTGAGDNEFDRADVLIVDYDLTADDSGGHRVGQAETGERIAYLVRCYSECGFVVGLNQFANRPTFDLTMIGHPSSYADINISGREIDNPALWGGTSTGYQPWSWPNLAAAPAQHRERVAAVLAAPDRSVLETLGLDDIRIRNAMTRRQLAWLSEKKNPHDVTVEQAMAEGRLGLKPRDRPWGAEGLASVAAARLGKWLARLVLPGQDILVDEPHLVSRYPSLQESDIKPVGRSLRGPDSYGLVAADKVRPHHVPPSAWFDRPVWLWPTMSEDDSIEEIADPFGQPSRTDLFCEDVSRFLPLERARPYSSDLAPFGRRSVADPPGGDDLRMGRFGIDEVEYVPAVAFAVA